MGFVQTGVVGTVLVYWCYVSISSISIRGVVKFPAPCEIKYGELTKIGHFQILGSNTNLVLMKMIFILEL